MSAAVSIYIYHHTPSGQSRLYRVTQLRTDGVHYRESVVSEHKHCSVLLLYILCILCVSFPSILDIKFVGRTSRGHTGGRSHRISHPPSFCGACLHFLARRIQPFLSLVYREVEFLCITNDLIVLHSLGIYLFVYF